MIKYLKTTILLRQVIRGVITTAEIILAEQYPDLHLKYIEATLTANDKIRDTFLARNTALRERVTK